MRNVAENEKDTSDSQDTEGSQYSQIVDIKQSSSVNGPLDLDTITDAPETNYSVQPETEKLEKVS